MTALVKVNFDKTEILIEVEDGTKGPQRVSVEKSIKKATTAAAETIVQTIGAYSALLVAAFQKAEETMPLTKVKAEFGIRLTAEGNALVAKIGDKGGKREDYRGVGAPMMDLRPFLVKVLRLNMDEVNGTGFVCHPDGYVLTCRHVVQRHIDVGDDKVVLLWQERPLIAQLLPNHSYQREDLAALHIVNPPSPMLHLALEVHGRTQLGDLLPASGTRKVTGKRKVSRS